MLKSSRLHGKDTKLARIQLVSRENIRPIQTELVFLAISWITLAY